MLPEGGGKPVFIIFSQRGVKRGKKKIGLRAVGKKRQALSTWQGGEKGRKGKGGKTLLLTIPHWKKEGIVLPVWKRGVPFPLMIGKKKGLKGLTLFRLSFLILSEGKGGGGRNPPCARRKRKWSFRGGREGRGGRIAEESLLILSLEGK